MSYLKNISFNHIIKVVLGITMASSFAYRVYRGHKCSYRIEEELQNQMNGIIVEISSPPGYHGALVMRVKNNNDTVSWRIDNLDYDFWVHIPEKSFVVKNRNSLTYQIKLPNGKKISHTYKCLD